LRLLMFSMPVVVVQKRPRACPGPIAANASSSSRFFKLRFACRRQGEAFCSGVLGGEVDTSVSVVLTLSTCRLSRGAEGMPVDGTCRGMANQYAVRPVT
jgi:hypothetical protein